MAISRRKKKAIDRRKRREKGYAHPTKKRAGSEGETYRQVVAHRHAETMSSMVDEKKAY